MVLSQTLNGLKEPTMSSTSDKERKGPFCKNDEGIVEDVQIKATESEEGTGTGGVGVEELASLKQKIQYEQN